MDAAQFHHALRVMYNLGEYELTKAGIVDENWGTAEASDRNQVEAYCANPFMESLRMPDANFDRLFALIERKVMK